jgi:hypothetical protein
MAWRSAIRFTQLGSLADLRCSRSPWGLWAVVEFDASKALGHVAHHAGQAGKQRRPDLQVLASLSGTTFMTMWHLSAGWSTMTMSSWRPLAVWRIAAMMRFARDTPLVDRATPCVGR